MSTKPGFRDKPEVRASLREPVPSATYGGGDSLRGDAFFTSNISVSADDRGWDPYNHTGRFSRPSRSRMP